jgi:hypothetical protein
VVNDLIGSRSNDVNKRGFLQRILDSFYVSIIFPLALLVASVFWGLYAVDRELIFPRALDKVFPEWLNHLMHTTIVPFVLVEMITVRHFYPANKSGFVLTTVFSLAYAVWTLVVYFVGNIWTYPFLEVMGWPGRVGFAGATVVVLLVLYMVGETFNKIYWGTAGTKSSKSKKKGKSN